MFQLRIAQIAATFMAACYTLPLVIDVSVLHLLLLAVTGWLDRRERRRSPTSADGGSATNTKQYGVAQYLQVGRVSGTISATGW
jgi:hypothetical protein